MIYTYKKIKRNIKLKNKKLKIKNKKHRKHIDFSTIDFYNYTSDNTIVPSFAEQRIINILEKNNIEYLREVSFKNFGNNDKHSFRFDFFIPQLGLIIEYDGEQHLQYRTNDTIKDHFLISKDIFILRLNKKNWNTLEAVIQMDINDNYIKEWSSAKLAMKTLNISHIGDICKGKGKTSGGFKWKYKNN